MNIFLWFGLYICIPKLGNKLYVCSQLGTLVICAYTCPKLAYIACSNDISAKNYWWYAYISTPKIV